MNPRGRSVMVVLVPLVGAACASTTATSTSGTAVGVSSSPAAALEGYRWELPCENHDPGAYGPKDVCAWDKALLSKGTADDGWKLKIEDQRRFGGRPDVVYDVTLRFRGVSEPKNYQGGEAIGEHFYVGGTEVRDDYNIYSVRVSDPPQVYYLTRDVRKTGHFTFAFDYTATVKIRGGAEVTLGLYDHNDEAIANGEHNVVPGVAPAPAPYSGHFVQMNVVSVSPRD